jgi:hypothetical protein
VRDVAATARVDGVPPRTLAVPREVLSELRVALLSDLCSAAEELQREIARIEEGLDADALDYEASSSRLCELVAAIKARHDLHRAVGFPGDPLAAIEVAWDACPLAVGIVADLRDAKVVRLAEGEMDERDEQCAIGTVALLATFLRDAQAAGVQAAPRANTCSLDR